MFKLKYTIGVFVVFLGFHSLLLSNEPKKKTKNETQLEDKYKAIDLMYDSQNQWLSTSRATTNLTYDSNTNTAPKDAPTSTRADSFINTLNYNLMSSRLCYKSSFNLGGDLEYKSYTYSESLNTADLNLFAKGQYFASNQFQMGSHVRISGHHQPKLLDASNVILSQNFSYFGLNFVPNWTYVPQKDCRWELIANVDRKWYNRTDKPGQYPYDNLVLQADLSFDKVWNTYKSKLKVGFTHDKYFLLPAFMLDASMSTTNKKILRSYLIKSEHSFPKLYIPIVFSLDFSATKDAYQGYENFYYLQPSLHASVPLGEDKKETLTCFLSYQNRQYTKRTTTTSNSQTKTHYNIVNSVVNYDHQVTKKFSFYESASYETRMTNEDLGASDRSYNKFVVSAGINYVF